MNAGTNLTKWLGAVANVTSARKARAAGALQSLIGPALATDDLEEREERAVARHELGQAFAAAGGLVGRAGARWLNDEIIHQENREAVAQITADLLEHDNLSSDPNEESALDPDWLNLFTSYAQKATGDSLREMWARVLAGEIRKPGTVSLRTLQFASTLDRPTAKAIQAMASWVFNGNQLPHMAAKHLAFETMHLLHDEGLIGSMDSDISINITLPSDWWGGQFGDVAVFLKGKPGQTVSIPGISVSRVAKELLGTISLIRDRSVPITFAEELESNAEIQEIRVGLCRRLADGSLSMPGETLMKKWTRPGVASPGVPSPPSGA